MRLVCPACGAMASLEAWANEEKIRECVALISGMPPEVVKPCAGYMALFRPKPRPLLWAKAVRIAREIRTLVMTGFVKWDGSVDRDATPAMWAEAMERMVTRPPRSLPLDNHNYLRKIVYDIAKEEAGKAETARNKAENSGAFRSDSGSGMDGIDDWKPMTKEEMRRIREDAKRRFEERKREKERELENGKEHGNGNQG